MTRNGVLYQLIFIFILLFYLFVSNGESRLSELSAIYLLVVSIAEIICSLGVSRVISSRRNPMRQ